MVSPREFYKSRHPDLFSDSFIEEATELDRSLLEYHLSSLTGRSQEVDFERFARRLCESQVCPNLVPTTGPTGGGDSKADSETYPVADRLTLSWYEGIGREASQERWAFAFSAKADWLPKAKSDVKKIVETRRGYTTAYFVTNQSVPAKRRAAAEDSLQKLHGVRVIILDRTWLLEKVFTGRLEDVAISELKITGLSRSSVRMGHGDAAWLDSLKAAEGRIAAAIETGDFGLPLVESALEAAEACRSLERPRMEVEGAYGRADRLAREYGTLRQQVEAAYQLAWTWCWWYEDYQAALVQYSVVEERAKGTVNVYDLERLLNLWTIVSGWLHKGVLHAKEPNWLEVHTATLRESLERLASDSDRPSIALEAKTNLLQLDLTEKVRAGSALDGVFAGYQEIVTGAEGLVGYPFEQLVEMLTVFGNLVEDSPAYNFLLDMTIEAAARRDGEVRAARLLLQRGNQLMDQERPAKAIAIVGQALGRLYKHETRREIVFALFLCGRAYERVGLLWAARATYLFGSSIAANDLWKYGSLSQGFVACVNGLKWIELRLGRLPHLLAWHELDLVVRERLEADSVKSMVSDEHEAGFDAVLARMIIRTPPMNYPALRSLPDGLDRLQLSIAANAALFLLGHTERLASMADDPNESADELATLMWNLKTDVLLPQFFQFFESQSQYVSLETKILGCQIKADCSTASPCVEVVEWLFAMLESFLATSSTMGAFAQEPVVTVKVVVDELAPESVSFTETEVLGRPHIIVRCQPFDPYESFLNNQSDLQDRMWLLTVALSARIVHFRDWETDLTTMFRDERVLDRAAIFTATMGSIRNVLGNAPKFRLEQWIRPDATAYTSERAESWTPLLANSKASTDERSGPIFGGKNKDVPEGVFDTNKFSHDQMEVISPIRQSLWDRAKWSGCVYMWYPDHEAPPVLGLMFGGEKEAALEIFASWRADFGLTDEARVLRVTIVRGIDRAHPHAYRVLIGANLQSLEDSGRLYMVMNRFHRMDAVSPVNLNGFVREYEKQGRFLLVPAFMNSGIPEPDFDSGLGLYEVNVRNAWEIGRHDPDVFAIQADDEVIIPDDILDPPVIELLSWKFKQGHSDTD